jgi:hypothetical protein
MIISKALLAFCHGRILNAQLTVKDDNATGNKAALNLGLMPMTGVGVILNGVELKTTRVKMLHDNRLQERGEEGELWGRKVKDMTREELVIFIGYLDEELTRTRLLLAEVIQ